MGIKHAILLGFCVFLTACGKHAPAPVFDLKQQGRSSGAAIIGTNDSAAALAGRYDLTLDDIITINGGRVTPGQHVQLPAPRLYRAHTGDTAQTVASMFDLRANDVIAQNGLQPPYRLSEGQLINLAPAAQALVYEPAPIASASIEPVTAQPLESVKPATISSSKKYARPVQGRVISSYGAKEGGLYNDGINIEAAAGTPVQAANDGTIVYAGNKVSGYGNVVMIRHDDGYFTVYGHMADTRVAKGARVVRGQGIGTVGTSGEVKAPQLHFEVRNGAKSLDPMTYLMPE